MTEGYMPVPEDTMCSVWLTTMGITGLPGDYFLQKTGDYVEVWLMNEGTIACIFVPLPGFEDPRVSATLSGSMIDTTTIVVNR